MIDIGQIKCSVPVKTGTFTFGVDGMVYQTSNGNSYVLTYKYINDLITKKNGNKSTKSE